VAKPTLGPHVADPRPGPLVATLDQTKAPLWPNTRPQNIFNDRFAFDYDVFFDFRLPRAGPDARESPLVHQWWGVC